MTSRRISRRMIAAWLILAGTACDDTTPASAPEPQPEHAAVASVNLDATALSMAPGASRQLVAIARDLAGRALEGRAIIWTSSDESVASVTANGRIDALRAGTALIRASAEGKTAEAAVAVVQPETGVRWVELTPAAAVVAVNSVVQLSALAHGDGNVVLNRPVTWTSEDTTIATVAGSGRVTGHRPGATHVRATVDGVTGSALVVVFAWTEHPLVQVNGAALPTTMLTVETPRRIRIDAHSGVFRISANGRWEHEVRVWLHPEGQVSTQGSYYYRGSYQRDLLTGLIDFHVEGELPSFSGRVLPNGVLEFAQQVEPGAPEVSFRYAAASP